MSEEIEIELAGPSSVHDSHGVQRHIKRIYIFNEGYGVIDVYVDFAKDTGDGALFEDLAIRKGILARLRSVGYSGADFGLADSGLQDDWLVVLEAGEEFNAFAASKGWRDLSEDFDEGNADSAPPVAAATLLEALIKKFKES